MGLRKIKESRLTPRFLARATRWMEVIFTVREEPRGNRFGREIRNAILDMLNLVRDSGRCQSESWLCLETKKEVWDEDRNSEV